MSRIARLVAPDLNRILPILSILMEVLWSFPWLIWVSSWPTFNWDGPPLNLIGCVLQGIGVGILNRFSFSRGWSIRRRRWVVITGILLLLMVIIRWNLNGGYSLLDAGWLNYAQQHIAEILTAFFFGIYLTWRGISVSRQNVDFSELYRHFIVGLTAFIVLLIIWGITGTQIRTIWSSAGAYVIAYFGLGLLALAVISLERLHTELLHHQEATGTFKRRMLSMMVVMVLIILGIAAAASNIFSSSGIQTFIHIVSTLGDWLLVALSYILLPLGYLLEALIYIGRWLINLIRNGTEQPQFNMPDLSDLQKAAEGQSPVHIPEALLLTLKWGGLALIIGLAIFLLARTLTRYWDSKNEEGVEEIHETLWSWSLLKTDLRSFLSWLFRWIHRRKKAPSEDILPPAPIAEGEKEIDRIFNIRELYQALLWQGRQIGVPRRKSETPYEYRQKLESRLTVPGEEIDSLTEAYIADKYGLVNPTPEEVTLLNRIWRTLRNKLQNSDGHG